jgi:hypothetical protein
LNQAYDKQFGQSMTTHTEQQLLEEYKMDALAEAVHDYVNNRRWDTLVGRSYTMTDEEGRNEFAAFLTTHIRGLLRHMDVKNGCDAVIDYHANKLHTDNREC